MARLIACGVFLSILVCASSPDLKACGDKFLFVGRVVKYQQTIATSTPGSILLYTNPTSKLPAAIQEMKLDTLLSLAGHRVDAIADASALTRALSTGRYDLLLVDAADAAHADQWRAVATGLVVVPVLYHPSKPEQAAAEQTYKRILRAPGKANETLTLVNEVMKLRPKARAAQTS
jgi:hypothetical protein